MLMPISKTATIDKTLFYETYNLVFHPAFKDILNIFGR